MTMRLWTVAMGGIVLASTAALAQTASGPVAVKPGSAITGKADAPQPPASATKVTKAGKGKTTIGTADSAEDDDFAWVETVDIDGDGNPEVTDIVWDDEDKVLFASASDAFACKNGGTGAGGMLIGVNATGNPRKRPAGSGFWIAELDKSECGSQMDCLWGCRFDASGNPTACGTVTVDEKNDDIIVTAVSSD